MNPRGLALPNEGRKVPLEHMLREAVELCWKYKGEEDRAPGTITNYERGIIDLLAASSFSDDFQRAHQALMDKREEMEREAEAVVERAEQTHNRAAEELTEARKRMEEIRG